MSEAHADGTPEGNAKEFAAVAGLSFARLTEPVLAEMRATGTVWRSLVDIAGRCAVGATGGEWGPIINAGQLRMSINPSGTVRCEIRFRNPNGAVGPDQMVGREVDVMDVHLPETMKAACIGREMREVIDPKRLHRVAAMARIRQIHDAGWGTRFVLDLKHVQPTIGDLEEIRLSCMPL